MHRPSPTPTAPCCLALQVPLALCHAVPVHIREHAGAALLLTWGRVVCCRQARRCTGRGALHFTASTTACTYMYIQALRVKDAQATRGACTAGTSGAGRRHTTLGKRGLLGELAGAVGRSIQTPDNWPERRASRGQLPPWPAQKPSWVRAAPAAVLAHALPPPRP